MTKKMWANLWLLLASVSIGLILSELVLRLLPNEFYYYRPHEMLSEYDDKFQMIKYKKYAKVAMTMPFGDLLAMDKHAEKSIAEPHKVTFATDSYGFRNDVDYHGQKYILVGDSFIVAMGDNQEDVLSSQLRRDYGIDAYNVSAPGGPTEYAKLVNGFSLDHAGDLQFLLFFFEGNDFPTMEENFAAAISENNMSLEVPSLYTKIRDIFKQSYIRRAFVRIRKSMKNEAKFKETGERLTRVYKIRGKDVSMGFFNNYIKTASRPEYDGGRGFAHTLETISDRVAYIFFIPTKYRVYYDLIDKPDNEPLPDVQWEYLNNLAKRLNVKCVNLTQPLIDESRKLLDEGKYTYWRDDTHWNKYGISTAAMVVYETLKGKRE